MRRKRSHYASPKYRRNRRLVLAGNPPCALCGLPGANSADHIVPISKGGSDDLWNLRPAHRDCNSSRGNRQRTRYSVPW